MLNYFPKYFTNKAIVVYIGTLLAVIVLFINRTMAWYWYTFGLIAVVCFFFYANSLTVSWASYSDKVFTRRLFITALIIRIVWVVFSYFFYNAVTGSSFEISAGDSLGYYMSGVDIGKQLKAGNFEIFGVYFQIFGISDMGYICYLGIMNVFFGESIILLRLFKALIGAFTCVLLYRLSVRTFGEKIGRIAATLCMLMPMLIFYCGLHLKEVEMVFLTVAFLERADFAMRSSKFTIANVLLPIVLAAILFTFRTVLGATAFFAFFSALLLTTKRTIKFEKRMILIIWVIVAVLYFMGGRVSTEIEEVWEGRFDNQIANIEWRSTKEGGNELARYAGAPIFIPAIFILPLPTIVETQGQDDMRFINGGYYVKNLLAFFMMLAIVFAFQKKEWKNFILIGSFTMGYLMVIALSAFASSGRFHIPALPTELMMTAYAIANVTNNTKKYYNIYLLFLFIVIVGWSWFKLAGRGL
jgi:hypothetical protein